MGLNKWEEMVVTDMARSKELSSMEHCDWWCAEVELHQVCKFTLHYITTCHMFFGDMFNH